MFMVLHKLNQTNTFKDSKPFLQITLEKLEIIRTSL